MRYVIGSFYYLKKDIHGAKENEKVKIVSRKKKGKKTYVSIETKSLSVIHGISFKILRARKR